MLFNSFEFIFLFLPLVLIGFHLIGKQGHHRVAIAWLVGASLFFYSWWNPAYLGLMLFSILFNYGIGVLLGGEPDGKRKKYVLFFGIAANLALLGYYKYFNFFVENINVLADSELVFSEVILPLAISFFTFQQIAYLVDTSRGIAKEYNFLHYCLFVTFFPQLIAGPIVHHKEVLPQFVQDSIYSLRAKHLAIGFTIFAIGLFKKVILADGVAVYATPVFDAAETGVLITFFEAWGGALAYTLQLYFDFSGYSDMAIGLARMFGIRLPLNFNSPYKATSIIDFWRRWHITLSRFLRDYLYIPLGGSRKGEPRRYLNIMITMLLGGLWHGAGWTFVLWGGLHGMYLFINHIWRKFRGNCQEKKLEVFLSRIITILVVVIAWVPFRADSIDGAWNILSGMSGIHGVIFPDTYLSYFNILFLGLGDYLSSIGLQFAYLEYFKGFKEVTVIISLLIVVMLMPNTQQLLHSSFETYYDENNRLRYKWMEWQPSLKWLIYIVSVFFISILNLTQISEFLYFQF